MMIQLPLWALQLSKKLGSHRPQSYKQQGESLRQGICYLNGIRSGALKMVKKTDRKLILVEQPFDLWLMSCSKLFRKSRKIYLEGGGKFVPSLLSSPRSLTSASLLDPSIEYSPIESEMIWAATDPIEAKTFDRLLNLRTYATSLFHEQNHRILWRLLPIPPKNRDQLRRYLNFGESLVITLDMALADQLGSNLAYFFYLSGVTYDPGTTVYQEVSSRRFYRNYLHAALHATYMNLEQFDPSDVQKATVALFPNLQSFAERAVLRSGNLDQAFIQETNTRWQRKHEKLIFDKLCSLKKPTLILPDSPLDNRQQYLIAESYFELMGL